MPARTGPAARAVGPDRDRLRGGGGDRARSTSATYYLDEEQRQLRRYDGWREGLPAARRRGGAGVPVLRGRGGGRRAVPGRGAGRAAWVGWRRFPWSASRTDPGAGRQGRRSTPICCGCARSVSTFRIEGAAAGPFSVSPPASGPASGGGEGARRLTARPSWWRPPTCRWRGPVRSGETGMRAPGDDCGGRHRVRAGRRPRCRRHDRGGGRGEPPARGAGALRRRWPAGERGRGAVRGLRLEFPSGGPGRRRVPGRAGRRDPAGRLGRRHRGRETRVLAPGGAGPGHPE